MSIFRRRPPAEEHVDKQWLRANEDGHLFRAYWRQDRDTVHVNHTNWPYDQDWEDVCVADQAAPAGGDADAVLAERGWERVGEWRTSRPARICQVRPTGTNPRSWVLDEASGLHNWEES